MKIVNSLWQVGAGGLPDVSMLSLYLEFQAKNRVQRQKFDIFFLSH